MEAGEYTAIDRPRRWHSPGHGTATTSRVAELIEIEFVDHGEQTTVILTNRGVPDREVADHRNGWENAFDNLAEALRS